MKKIRVYTKNHCGYCDAAKAILEEKGVNFEEINISYHPEVIHELVEKSGLMTVPQVFVGEDCLGGYSDIKRLDLEGRLDEALGLKLNG